jgi:hypothetical protein
VIALLLARPRLLLAGAGMIAAALLLWRVYAAGERQGAGRVVETINRENQEARDAAEKSGNRVDACYGRGPDWVWSVPRGECVRAEWRAGQ